MLRFRTVYSRQSPPPEAERRLSHAQQVFLGNLLTEYESRRTAADNRAYVLSVFSGAQLVFLLQNGTKITTGTMAAAAAFPIYSLVTALAAIAFWKNINMVLPLRRKRQNRKNDNTVVQSLTWFWHVGNRDPADYTREVGELVEQQLRTQMSTQLVGIAGILRKRYTQAIRAGQWLKLSLTLTVATTLADTFWN